MPLFVWTPRLAVGFPDMDEQHRVLIGLMNELENRVQAPAPPRAILETLSELGARSVEHFGIEERLMASFEYPDIDVHHQLHRGLMDRFGEHRRELETTGTFSAGFSEFLQRWLNAHISGPDTKYGVYSGQLTRR